MTEHTQQFESLLEKATDYGKISFELVKLKAVDKISDGVSSLIPNTISLVLILIFTLFLNIGLAFWLGEILGKIYLGFIVTSAFYLLLGLIFHFALHKSIKNKIQKYIINLALN